MPGAVTHDVSRGRAVEVAVVVGGADTDAVACHLHGEALVAAPPTPTCDVAPVDFAWLHPRLDAARAVVAGKGQRSLRDAARPVVHQRGIRIRGERSELATCDADAVPCMHRATG